MVSHDVTIHTKARRMDCQWRRRKSNLIGGDVVRVDVGQPGDDGDRDLAVAGIDDRLSHSSEKD